MNLKETKDRDGSDDAPREERNQVFIGLTTTQKTGANLSKFLTGSLTSSAGHC